jgi:hypothetical protein
MLSTDDVIRQWQEVLAKDFKTGNTFLNTILFADEQAIFSESDDDQRAVNRLENIANGFNMRISTMKTNAIAFQVENHIRCKIAIRNKTIEKVSSFNYFSFNASYNLKEDINFKLGKFQRIFGMI